MAGITRDWAAQNTNKIVRRNGGNSPSRQVGTVSLQPGNSNPVILVVGRKGEAWTTFFRLGQPEGSGPELIRTETQICLGPRRTLGSHHLNSATHEFSEIKDQGLGGFFAT